MVSGPSPTVGLASRALGVAWLLGLLATGCSPVTQLLVVVRSDLPPADVAEVHIDVVPGEPFTAAPTTRQAIVGVGDGFVAIPFSFGVLPRNGDPRSRVEITVRAVSSAGATTVTRLVRTGFSEGRTLAVPVFLAAACRDRTCPSGSTCIDGTCGSPEVPVEDLVPVRPGEELAERADAGTGLDAPGLDAPGLDAPGLDAPGLDAAVDPTVDASVPSGVGFAAPTHHTLRSGGPYVFVRAIVPAADGGLYVLADTSDQEVFDLAGTRRSAYTANVVRLGADLTPMWAYSMEGDDVHAVSGALVGERLFVCGSFDGQLRPDGLSMLTAPSDGIDDGDDESFLLELDASGPTPRAMHPIVSGTDALCRRVVASDTTLGVLLEVPSTSGVTFDGAAVSLDGCATPDTALLRWDTGSGLAPLGGISFRRTSPGGTDVVDDGAGGFYVAVSSIQSGQENANRSCGAGGAALSAELLHVERSGTIGWARTLLESPEVGVTSFVDQRVTTSGDRVVVLGAFDTFDAPYSVHDAAGTELSASAATPRLVWASVRASDGDDAHFATALGSVRETHLVGREPDVVFCGQTPSPGLRDGFRSDLFGMGPVASDVTGFVVAIGPTGAARWIELATGQSAWVGDCASDGHGGLFAAPTFLNLPGGTFRGESYQGAAIFHLEP